MRSSRIVVLAATLLWSLCANHVSAEQNGARPSEPALYGFHLVLLAAHRDAAEWMNKLDLPPGAAKALRDAGEFLPYKGYVVLDDVRVRAQLNSEARTALQYGDTQYLAVVRADNEPMQVSVRLSQHVAVPNGRREMEVLSATFNAVVGETVVVGTSKVQGTEQAVVLLLTPLPSPPPGAR